MNESDHAPLIALAMLAARADGTTDAAEQAAIDAVIDRIGAPDVSRLADQVKAGSVRAADLAGRLSDDDARRAAYASALAVCHADGPANPDEATFLEGLRDALGLDAAAASEMEATAGGLSAPLGGKGAAALEAGSPGESGSDLDDFILDQAILTGALEVLPDSLANLAVLPLQLRMVYQIGQRHGQQLDAGQVKDLAATLGLGAAAQAIEGVAIRLLGGVAGGLLGGLVGGAARVAGGTALTFAATYALGHVADQYYAQGRRLSGEDLRAQFVEFQQEARTLYPKVEEKIRSRAGTVDLQSLKRSLGARVS
ncbi:MAG TPA: DUF533 domain-containing protein [Gemmatimonadota bacterium]|nr:DUF533 domain-containing protein [Gemmatimonadota bacterium]